MLGVGHAVSGNLWEPPANACGELRETVRGPREPLRDLV